MKVIGAVYRTAPMLFLLVRMNNNSSKFGYRKSGNRKQIYRSIYGVKQVKQIISHSFTACFTLFHLFHVLQV